MESFVRIDAPRTQRSAIAAIAFLDLREAGTASADERDPPASLLKQMRGRFEPALLIVG